MKRRIQGTIVSDKMQSTAVVEVRRLKKHPKYQKYYKVTTRFKAHNEGNVFKLGDTVIMEEVRPLSKDKRFKIIQKVEKQDIIETPVIEEA